MIRPKLAAHDVELLPPRRKRIPGPEAELLDAALAAWRGAIPVVFYEPRMPTGFPDIVAVMLHRADLLFNARRSRLRPEHLRLLHHLHMAKRASERQLGSSLLLRPAKLSSLLADLEAAELIRRTDRRIVARSLARAFAARRIIAVEAKVRDWRRALDQAVANTWFASHSYVLLPESSWSPILGRRARRLGVGVVLSDGSRLSIRVPARKHLLPASYGSWLVNEWALRQTVRMSRP